MKPISIVHLISSLRKGGRERQLATIYKYTDHSRFPTKIICFNDADQDFLAQYGLQGDIHFLKTRGWRNRLREILHFISLESPDFIFSWGESESLYGLVISMVKPAKFINGSVRHGILSFKRSHIVRMLILHMSPRIVANSQAGLKANFLTRGEVLYNGVDDALISSTFSNSSYKINNTAPEEVTQTCPSLLSVANLVPYKDYETILRALSDLKKRGYNFRYTIVGDGPMRNDLKEMVNNSVLNGDVYFAGQVASVAEFYQRADILVHSSKGEGCSNAIIEAMFHGLPIIASDTGGTREIVTEGTGCLFPYRNSSVLGEKIALLVDDPRLLHEMGNRARQYALSTFTPEIMIENYHSILTRFANG